MDPARRASACQAANRTSRESRQSERMSTERILEVKAQEDFVETLAAAGPAQALAELIWNGLDAEATRVSVEPDQGPLGLTRIRIRDNGHWVKTWAQIIHESRSRLTVFQKELNHSADQDASLGFLNETYARVLQGVDLRGRERIKLRSRDERSGKKHEPGDLSYIGLYGRD